MYRNTAVCSDRAADSFIQENVDKMYKIGKQGKALHRIFIEEEG